MNTCNQLLIAKRRHEQAALLWKLKREAELLAMLLIERRRWRAGK